jgi:DNA-binding NtrC family response regulator
MSTKRTLLVVDDDAHIRDFLAAALGRDYEVLLAEDGAEAVEVYLRQRERIDCVLTDLLMPRLDGEELIERLHLENPTLPMLLMSALQDNDQLRQIKSRPCVSLISKPFHLRELKDAIRLAMNENVGGEEGSRYGDDR